MLKDLALENPDLDTEDTESGYGFGRAVVDVGAQRMKRHSAFAIPFRTGDFRAAETACAGDLDAFGAETHGRLDGTLHGAAECDATFKLLGDRLGDQGRVDFRLSHFNNVEVRFRTGHLGKLLAELLDVGALLADDQARPSRLDRDPALLVRHLVPHLGDTGLLHFLLAGFANPPSPLGALAQLGTF